MTYLLLLFSVAVTGAALAGIGHQWQVEAQRDRETELLFRGMQIRAALQAYQTATPPGAPALPLRLADLLDDPRVAGITSSTASTAAVTRHWLRQIYPDPFTRAADWVLLRTPEGGIYGVHSASRLPALRQHGLPIPTATPPNQPPSVGDWRFQIDRLQVRTTARQPATP